MTAVGLFCPLVVGASGIWTSFTAEASKNIAVRTTT